MSFCVQAFTKVPVILPVQLPQVTPKSSMCVKSDAPTEWGQEANRLHIPKAEQDLMAPAFEL
jgi:hypothetical protein